jgi:ribulose-phosphate 3-epimerase
VLFGIKPLYLVINLFFIIIGEYKMIKIAPSILSADFSRLGKEIARIEKAGADLIHFDVMDGHFVPNITFGPPVLKCLKRTTDLPFDVHLMIENADDYIDDFADAGADIISVHVESCTHLNRTIQKIKNRGVKPAVVLNPSTPLSSLEWILEYVDMVLIMSVNPGFGGQAFIENSIGKIYNLKNLILKRNLDVDIEVDGGVNLDNIYRITKAGANVIVAGSTVFNAPDINEIINQLKKNAYGR